MNQSGAVGTSVTNALKMPRTAARPCSCRGTPDGASRRSAKFSALGEGVTEGRGARPVTKLSALSSRRDDDHGAPIPAPGLDVAADALVAVDDDLNSGMVQ
jgi:hypothetical protein